MDWASARNTLLVSFFLAWAGPASAADAGRARVLTPEPLDADAPKFERIPPAAENRAHFIARSKHLIAFARANPGSSEQPNAPVAGVKYSPVTSIIREALRVLDLEGDDFDVALRNRVLRCDAPKQPPPAATIIRLNAQGRGLVTPVFLNPSANALRYYELSLDRPGEPVVLMITGYDGIALRITTSPGTNLSAVHVQGHYPSVILGVDPLRVTQRYEGCGGKVSAMPAFLPVAAERQKEEHYTLTGLKGHQIAIGTPQPVKRERPLLGSFFDPEMPLPNSYGMVALTHLGYVRLTTLPRRAAGDAHGSPYEVLKPFRMPEGLYGGHSVILIVNDSALTPSGNTGHSSIVRPIRK